MHKFREQLVSEKTIQLRHIISRLHHCGIQINAVIKTLNEVIPVLYFLR